MKRAMKLLGAALAGIIGLLTVYGVLIEPRLILDERHYEAALPNLGTQWEGAEIAVISDIQVGMWFANTAMVERIVDRAVEEDPEAVLIAGDFLYSNDPGNQEKIDTVLDLLAPITDAGIPSYAVLGNHDHIVGAAEELTTALESRGVTVLLNESAEVPLPDGNPAPPLHVVGLGPAYQGLADSEKAFSGIPASDARIVMMHNPDTFPTLPPDSAPLAVAGHTHCGQIAVPGTPDWSWLAWECGSPILPWWNA